MFLVALLLLSNFNLINSDLTEDLLNLPKCCVKNEMLGKDLSCKRNKVMVQYNHYYIYNNTAKSNFSFFDNCTNNEYCIDYSETENAPIKLSCDAKNFVRITNDLMFHKCCPSGRSYNTTIRGCTLAAKNNNFSFKFPYVKFGLSNCHKAIVDYHVNSFDDLKVYNYENLNFETYCIDQIANDGENDTFDGKKFVIRICHQNNDVCKMNSMENNLARCFKKCCPDGYMYHKGTACVPTFNSGIQLNDGRIMSSPNSKYIINHLYL